MVVVVVLSAIAIRRGLSCTGIQDTFGIHEMGIFVGRSGIEHVLLGITMNAVGLEDPGGSGIGERTVHFEEGVLM